MGVMLMVPMLKNLAPCLVAAGMSNHLRVDRPRETRPVARQRSKHARGHAPPKERNRRTRR